MNKVIETPDYRITYDEDNWILATKPKNYKSGIRWKRYSYFPRLNLLLDDLLNYEIKSVMQEEDNIMKIIKHIQKAMDNVVKIAKKYEQD